MPKELEEKLKKEAKKRGYAKKRTGAYVYGTLRKAGWEPSHQKKKSKKKSKKKRRRSLVKSLLGSKQAKRTT